MEKENRRFELFLNDIHPDAAFEVTELHGRLVEMGCVVKLQEAKNGHVVSYHDPAGKRVVANFVSRKSGPVIRIYGDGVASYETYLQELPAPMLEKIAKAPDCRRMLDPTKCNARCAMGYDFTIKGTRYQKCRYNCFLFPVEEATWACLKSLLEREMQSRASQ